MRDLISNIDHIRTGIIEGFGGTEIVDLQNYYSVCFNYGVIGGTTVNTRLEESDDGITWNAIESNVVWGEFGNVPIGDNYKLSYTGYKRYIAFKSDVSFDATIHLSIIGERNSSPNVY